MPSSIATVNPTFRLTNRAYTVLSSDLESYCLLSEKDCLFSLIIVSSPNEDSFIDWQFVPTNRFQTDRKITVLTHGWNDSWTSSHWLNDARDAFYKEGVNFVGVEEWIKNLNFILLVI